MAKMNSVSWFEIPVKDLARAKKFYESVLGVKLQLSEMGPMQMAWFPSTMGAAGAAGTLVQAKGYRPSKAGSIVYISVKSIPTTLTKIKKLGGEVVMPKTSIGEWGSIAHFIDCEGNRVALHSA